MKRPSGLQYKHRGDRLAAAARDRRHGDGESWKDELYDDDGSAVDDGSGKIDDHDDGCTVEAGVRKKYSRSARDVVDNIHSRAIDTLRVLELNTRFDRLLYALIAEVTMRVAGVAALGQRIHFREGFTEAALGDLVVIAVAQEIKQRALKIADQRSDMYINLKMAAVLESKDPADHRNLGLETLIVDQLHACAAIAFRDKKTEEEIAFRETILTKELTVMDRIFTFAQLASAYSKTGNEQKALTLKEQLLAYLRTGIAEEYGRSGIDHPLPVAIYRTRLSIARSRERLQDGADHGTADDERITAAIELLDAKGIDPDDHRNALELLIKIFRELGDFRSALRYSLQVLRVAREQGRNEPARARIVERTKTLGELCPDVQSLDEALRLKDTLTINALIEWVEQAEADGNLQAQIALREEILKRSVLSDDGRIKTLIFLSYNYEEAGDVEKAFVCLERVIEIKRRIGEASREELAGLRARGQALMDAIPPDPVEVLAEALRNPMIREMFDFLTAFQSRAQDWVNDDGGIVIPATEGPALIDGWAAIMRNEERIVATVGVKRLRGLMCKFRDNLKGGNMKRSTVRQILAIFQPPESAAADGRLASPSPRPAGSPPPAKPATVREII